ncbi:MFS transporter [Actinomycetospora soli]|uniref:MFS transporter n=1 Tax=Actinomycetospora soli TaxID=2893887 RepID=UPI001E5D403A|nr:MFS transporter [Actinomycetospora soli]MCD2191457.1 MFS transporter [Actinomycetospora soli]
MRPAQRARPAVLAVFLLHALLFGSWTAHIPQVKAGLGLSDAELGLALLGAPLGSVLAMALTGWLLPRLGSRRTVQVTLVGYALTGLLIGVAPSLPWLFGALLVWGGFQGAVDVAMNTQAVTVERALGTPIMAGLHGGWSLGGFCGALLGTAVAATGTELTPQLAVLGPVVLVLGGLASRRMIPDPPEPTTEAGHDLPSGRVLVRPVVLLLGGIALASMLAEGASADWSAVHLRDDLAAGPGVAGLAYAAYSATMLTLRLTGDRLLTRLPAHRLLPVLALVAAVGFGSMLFVAHPAATIVGFGLLGVGLALVVPTAFSAAGRLPGVHPGRAIAAVSALGWVGFVAGPPVIGHLAAWVGLPVALGLLPLLALVIALGARNRVLDRS